MRPNRRERRARRSSIVRTHSKRSGWQRLPIDRAVLDRHPACAPISRIHANETYSVQVYELETEWGQVDHLIVRRHDERPVRSWGDLQAIKDEICSPDRTAVEVFPPADDLVDQANLYHLWVLPTGFLLPFGLDREGAGYA